MGRGQAKETLLSNPPSNIQYTPYAGGYHQRQGYATASPTDSQRASNLFVPNSRWTWAFLAVTILQAIIGLALEGFVFADFQIKLTSVGRKDERATSRTVPAYLSLFIFGFIYQVLLAWDALRLKNTIQIIGLCLYNVGLLVEAAVQSDQISDAVHTLRTIPNVVDQGIPPGFWAEIHPFIIAVPCVIALGTVLLSLVAWKLYGEFAWSIYKHISADTKLRRMYLSYQVYIALLKFDFFFFLAFTVQFLVVVPRTSDFEFYITIVAVPVTIILLFLAGYWTRKENTYGMVAIIVVYFAGLAYFLFKLVRMYDSSPAREEDYRPARKSLTTFAVITVILLIVTITYACLCMYNFGKGLKTLVASGRKHIGRRRAGSEELDKLYPNTLDPIRQERIIID